ncbi:dimer_Tnp_hAT domain-containing protein [Nephila pilipes]|uniref:Dimer_Tnp_hAT domain-containing protein n=1 Tax=Nephila pilipes TaxID=299642 RepID=A0A8X6PEE9_NEPPI|nr:dimer_Tnp_hAT domain-containing protein [Nephila pilipes]
MPICAKLADHPRYYRRQKHEALSKWSRKRKKKIKRKLEIAESQKKAPHKCLGTITLVPSSSISDNPQCTSTSTIFPEASASEVKPFIPTDSEQNKGDDSEKGDNEEVQSNNESNHDRESEKEKDRPERFIDLDVEMLNDIALWPTTLTDLMLNYSIKKKTNNISNIETLKSVYKDRDQEHLFAFFNERLPEIKKKAVHKLKDIYKDDIELFNFDDELDQFLLFLKENKDTTNTPIDIYRIAKEMVSTFPNVEILLKIFLTIPISNASVERSISVLKSIKNHLRSSIGEDKLNSMAILYIEKDVLDQIDTAKIIDEFAKEKSRRKVI